MMLGVGSVGSILLLATAAGVTAPSTAASQDEAAQQSFRAGVEAARQERWADARSMFEKAYALSPRPVVLINLAGAQARTGRLTEAAKNYHRVLDDPPSQETAPFRRAAAEVLPALEARIPRVKMRPSGLSPTDVIRIDAEIVAADVLATGHPLDPGEHTLVVQNGGVERARVLFAVAERELRSITLPLPSLTQPPVPTVAAVLTESNPSNPPDREPAPERSLWTSPWTWTAIGLVVAAGSATAVVLYQRQNDEPFVGNIPPGTIQVP